MAVGDGNPLDLSSTRGDGMDLTTPPAAAVPPRMRSCSAPSGGRYTGGRGQARSARCPRRASGCQRQRHQGRLAPLGADQPPRPDRRRSGGVTRRDPAHGRDQRRLCRPDPRHRSWRPFPRGRRAGRLRGPGPEPPGWSAATQAVASGDRQGRHDRDVHAAQSDDRAADRRAIRTWRSGFDRRCAASGSTVSHRAPPPRPGRWSAIRSVISAVRHRRRSTPRGSTSSSSASSMATRSARSPASSRPTSTGWPAP